MLRFANNIALLVNTERELEKALNVTKAVLNNYNMKVNRGKTKAIACRKKRLNIKTGNEKIGKINEFCYLGSKITRDGRFNAGNCSRIGQAKIAFAKTPQLLVLNIDLEIRQKC